MKHTILVLLTLIMLLSFTACSSSESEEGSADESTETTEVSSESSSANGFEAFQDEANSLAESSDANVEESSEDDGKVNTVNNDYDTVYLQWKYSNWESASDEDRRKCAIAYLGYYGDVLGWEVTEEDMTDEQLEKIETSLEGALENNQDFTVQEIILYILSEDSSSSTSSES